MTTMAHPSVFILMRLSGVKGHVQLLVLVLDLGVPVDLETPVRPATDLGGSAVLGVTLHSVASLVLAERYWVRRRSLGGFVGSRKRRALQMCTIVL